jgi:hypothetical protein
MRLNFEYHVFFPPNPLKQKQKIAGAHYQE